MARKKLDVDVVRKMAAEGKTDREIGESLMVVRSAVSKLRRHHGIQKGGKTNNKKIDVEIVRQMAESGHHDREIAVILGCGATGVTACRKRNGIPTPHPPVRTMMDAHTVRRMVGNGLFDREIADLFKCGVSTVSAFRKRNGISAARYVRKTCVYCGSCLLPHQELYCSQKCSGNYNYHRRAKPDLFRLKTAVELTDISSQLSEKLDDHAGDHGPRLERNDDGQPEAGTGSRTEPVG